MLINLEDGCGRPSLGALMNTSVDWLTYLRHDGGDSQPDVRQSNAALGGLALRRPV
jgi:hypothetical protein